MEKIILISCTANKEENKCKAEKMYYKSEQFRLSLEYAKLLQPNKDKIFILSALYELLNLDDEIEKYNVTLCRVPKEKKEKTGVRVLTTKEKIIWTKEVLRKLREKTNLDEDQFIILAPKCYWENLIYKEKKNEEGIKNYELPLQHFRQGEQKKELKRLINEFKK